MFWKNKKRHFFNININTEDNSSSYITFIMFLVTTITSLIALYISHDANIQSIKSYKTNIRPVIIAIWFDKINNAIEIRNFSEGLAFNFWWFLNFETDNWKIVKRDIIIWKTLTLASSSNKELSSALMYIHWYIDKDYPINSFCIDYEDIEWNKYYTAGYIWLSFNSWVWKCSNNVNYWW